MRYTTHCHSNVTFERTLKVHIFGGTIFCMGVNWWACTHCVSSSVVHFDRFWCVGVHMDCFWRSFSFVVVQLSPWYYYIYNCRKSVLHFKRLTDRWRILTSHALGLLEGTSPNHPTTMMSLVPLTSYLHWV